MKARKVTDGRRDHLKVPRELRHLYIDCFETPFEPLPGARFALFSTVWPVAPLVKPNRPQNPQKVTEITVFLESFFGRKPLCRTLSLKQPHVFIFVICAVKSPHGYLLVRRPQFAAAGIGVST